MRPLDDPIPNTCFMSSIKITVQDVGFDLDIRPFIDRFPELCHKGISGKEFAFHVTRENLKTVSGVMGFECAFHLDLGLKLANEYTEDSRALLSFHRWNGSPDHAHCIVSS